MFNLNNETSNSGLELYTSDKTLLESLATHMVTDSSEPLLEVYMTTQIPNLRIYRTRTILPFDKSKTSKGNIVFLNTKRLEDSIKIMTNPNLANNNHYRRYYIDWKYNIRVLNRTYIRNIRKERINIYTKVQNAVPNMMGLNNLDTAHGINLFFDMHVINNFFLERESKFTNYKLKTQEFMRILKMTINDPRLNEYKGRVMFIDIKSWIPGELNRNLTKKQFNNIVFVFYYLMRKDFKEFTSIGDIDLVFLGDKGMFRLNPSKFTEKDIVTYKRLINILSPKEIIPENIDELEDEKSQISQTVNTMNTNRFIGKNKGKIEKQEDEQNEKPEEKKPSFVEKALKIINDLKMPEEKRDQFDIAVARQEIFDTVAKAVDKYGFTGTPNTTTGEIEVQDNVKKRVDDEVSKRVEGLAKANPDSLKDISKVVDDVSSDIANDEDFRREIKLMRAQNSSGRSTSSMKRDAELREKQAKLKLKGVEIGNGYRHAEPDDVKLKVKDVSEKVNTTNPNVTKISFPDFEKEYNEKLYTDDILNCVKCLNNKNIPIYIRDIKTENTSDELNLKETWTVHLEDEYRNRHTLKFDIPIFYQDKFLYLGGNKKMINKQQMMKPIIKTGPETVQLCSNYKKIFIHRYGNKATPDVEALFKVLDTKKTGKGLVIKKGNVSESNSEFKSIFDYDAISKFYQEISYKNTEREIHFIFDQKVVKERLKGLKISESKIGDKFCIGYIITKGKAEPILVDFDTELVEGISIPKFIATSLSPDINTEFNTIKPGKKYIYSRAVIMKKKVALIFILSYLEGLSTIMRKAGIRYQFTDTRPREKIFANQSVVKFADGFLVYENMPFEKQLLMNGLSEMHTEDYNFSEFDEKDVYIDLMEMLYNRRNIGSAFEQFYEFFVDPKTEQILSILNYPTNFVDIVLFANALLADNQYTTEIDMNCSRIRSNEIVMSFLYNGIADAYLKYKNTVHNNNPVKLSMPQDYVIKELVQNQIVEDYSKLNPIVELEKSRVCTPKGINGVNLADSFTEEKRSYHDTMVGIFGMSTSPEPHPLGLIGVIQYKNLL